MSESLRAVFRDQQGRTYSCPVVKNEGAWAMVTSEGPRPITHEFQDDDAGLLTFVEYRQTEDSRLHVERLPGESNFGAIQRAFAEQKITTQRKQRQQSRADAQTQAARKIEQSRHLNNEFAAVKKPRGKGAAFVIEKGE